MARRGRRNTRARTVNDEIVGWAVEGLTREIAATQARLATLTSHLASLRGRAGRRAMASPTEAPAAGRVASRRRPQMTAEGRQRISAMMKKRWAEAKKKKQNRLT